MNSRLATALWILGALALTTGLATAETKLGPVKPGDVRITTRSPEPEKWDVQQSATAMQRLFKCKPLACPEPQSVSFKFSRSPTRHPDPKALERFASVDLPKSIRAAAAAREVMSDGAEKIETVSSKTATLKGYPSVLNETRLTQGAKSTYMQTAIIFAGPIMIRVQSMSPNQELARKALDQFIEVMRIEEGPPLPPSGTPGVPAPKSQSL